MLEKNSLPSHWVSTSLENVVDIFDSLRIPINAKEREKRIANKKQEELYPYYGATGLVGFIDDFIFDGPLLLLGEDGVPFLDPMKAKAFIVSGKYWVNNHAHVLRARKELAEQRYLCSFLNSYDFREKVTGTTRLKLTQEAMRSISVPLAPLPEQKRIADKLDTLLARVDSCQSHLERVPQILKRFRQSVLAAATSGRLTEEWRNENGRGLLDWIQVPAEDLIENIEAGINVKCDERPPLEHERGLVKISAVTWGQYNDNESKTLPKNHEIPDRTRIKVGDFLISRANTIELVGACVIVDQVNRPVFLSDKVLRLVMNDDVKRWMLYWLRSDAGRKQIESLASGNQLSMRNISQANLRNIQVNLPKPDERDEIVRRVERLFAFAERLEARWRAGQELVEQLTPSLLAKAFRGELVEQDGEDEPAAVLLERIRTARSRQGVIRNLRGKLNWEGDLDEQRKSRFTAK